MACGREGSGMDPEMWKKPFVGKGLALFGPVGPRVFTHTIRGVERAREVWAARRALFLPDSDGAGDDAG